MVVAVVVAPGKSISVGRVLGNRHVKLRRSRTSEELGTVFSSSKLKPKNRVLLCT